ncbi:hypothetical protein ACFLSW_03180 [Candidatus Bipolaricaulota bacterium]
MHRIGVVALAFLLAACSMVYAVEIGVRFHISHDPYAVSGDLPLQSGAGLFGLYRTDQGLSVRVSVDSPLSIWAPSLSLRSALTINPRWTVDADLSIKEDLDETFRVTLAIGGRASVATGPRSRIAIGSLPLLLVALRLQDEWSFHVVPSISLFADAVWAISPSIYVGETVGAMLIPFMDVETPLSIRLSEQLGVLFSTTTRFGFVP